MYTGSNSGNEHSPHRYYPSPLNTVDAITKDGGPVWVNAAGNAELQTLWFQKPEVIDNDDSPYDGYVIFDTRKSNTDDADRTCQRLPVKTNEVNYYAMRWADTWPNASIDLDYEMHRVGWGRWIAAKHDHSGDRGKTQYQDDDANSNTNYPIRRTSKQVLVGRDVCLRIYTNTGNSAPKWIQFQILTSRDVESNDVPQWESGVDVSGRSIVNPAESHNEALLAVGALDSVANRLTAYSSRGPVFSSATSRNFKFLTPSAHKPDLVTATAGATYNNWLHKCGKNARTCDGLMFKGTSGATSHTGGIAAIVTQLFDELGHNYEPADVADFRRDTAVDIAPAGPDSTWGHGVLQLPCPPDGVGARLPYRQYSRNWSPGDCATEQSARAQAKADYHTFALDQTYEVTITLSSTNRDSYLYLYDGAHHRGELLAEDDNGGSDSRNRDAKITRTLNKGIYTVEATTKAFNNSGFYTLEITGRRPTGAIVPPGETQRHPAALQRPVQLLRRLRVGRRCHCGGGNPPPPQSAPENPNFSHPGPHPARRLASGFRT